jgi:RNA polymerase sigma factor (sigma-70 family)
VRLPPFQRLIDEHGGALWRYCVAALGPHDGADVLQDTYLTALRAYPDLRDATNLRGWLFAVARSRVVDRVRSDRRAPIATDRLPEPITSPPPDPDDDLWRRVRALPDGQRDAIALRVVADLAYRDVAAVLGCSEAAARQRVRAGLAALRADLTEEDAS